MALVSANSLSHSFAEQQKENGTQPTAAQAVQTVLRLRRQADGVTAFKGLQALSAGFR